MTKNLLNDSRQMYRLKSEIQNNEEKLRKANKMLQIKKDEMLKKCTHELFYLGTQKISISGLEIVNYCYYCPIC